MKFEQQLFDQLSVSLQDSEPITDFDLSYDNLNKNTKHQLIHMLLVVANSSRIEKEELWDALSNAANLDN